MSGVGGSAGMRGKAVEASGWEEVEEGKEQGSDFFYFPPGSPSDCLPDESYGAGYVDKGFLERQVEVYGNKVTVRVAYTAAGVEDWLAQCSQEDKLFGFDVEWRPNRQRGEDNKVALLQLCLASRCLLVQLLQIDLVPVALKKVLADPAILLGGVSVKTDIQKLEEDHGLRCCGEVDLGTYAATVMKRKELRGAGLSTLSQLVLGLPSNKSKSVTMSNWEVEGLSFGQIQYAATDAWISYSLLVALNKHACS